MSNELYKSSKCMMQECASLESICTKLVPKSGIKLFVIQANQLLLKSTFKHKAEENDVAEVFPTLSMRTFYRFECLFVVIFCGWFSVTFY